MNNPSELAQNVPEQLGMPSTQLQYPARRAHRRQVGSPWDPLPLLKNAFALLNLLKGERPCAKIEKKSWCKPYDGWKIARFGPSNRMAEVYGHLPTRDKTWLVPLP